ncbi:MAG: response regulator [Proteobacteria bacterium]|nr:response regulator [Pseudomonadota bacterium]MBU1708698.1 response regulator [Pseudomonadota bacterium]
MKKVLLIDDDPTMRGMIKLLLEFAGFEVIEADDGQQGIDKYRELQTELVITDMVMPNKTGLSMINDLLQEYPDAKIIAMSGGAAIDADRYLTVADKLGVEHILKKPFTQKELFDAIQDYGF